MFASKPLLTAFMLVSLLASGVASALPHPQAGHAKSIDLQSVVRSLDDCIACDAVSPNDAGAVSRARGPIRTAD